MTSLDQQQGLVLEDLHPKPTVAFKRSLNSLPGGSRRNSRFSQFLPLCCSEALNFFIIAPKKLFNPPNEQVRNDAKRERRHALSANWPVRRKRGQLKTA